MKKEKKEKKKRKKNMVDSLPREGTSGIEPDAGVELG